MYVCYGISDHVGSQDAPAIFDHWCWHADLGNGNDRHIFIFLEEEIWKEFHENMYIQEILLCRSKEITAKRILIGGVTKTWPFPYLFICRHFLPNLSNEHIYKFEYFWQEKYINNVVPFWDLNKETKMH